MTEWWAGEVLGFARTQGQLNPGADISAWASRSE
jgi:hypothetical protein